MTKFTAAYSSVEAICNAALAQIGYPESIAQIREGTRHARVAIRLYGQTRDALLKSRSWQFAQRQAVLSTTGFVVAPWTFQYALPADYLMARNVLPTPVSAPDLNPTPILFTIYNDARATPSQVLLTNQATPTLLYTAQITDPTQWEPGFMEALIAALAAKFVPALADARMMQGAEALAGRAEDDALGATELQPPVDVPARGAA